MKIVFVLFDNFTVLDIAGPYEVLNKLPDTEIIIAGLEKKEYRDIYGLRISADSSIDEIDQSDILLIPGGTGIDVTLQNERILSWIRKMNRSTTWTISVCSGSLLLAQAGLLEGKKCTTHWLRKEQMERYNVKFLNERYVQDGKIITSAGVSAGIDMALYLVGKIAGEQTARMIQLAIEYDPKPPLNYIGPHKLPKEIIDKFKAKNR